MGRVCIQIDDNYETLIRRKAQEKRMSLSEYVRQKLIRVESSAPQKDNLPEEFLRQQSELVELRKELRIITGGIVEVMKAYNVSLDEMKRTGNEFFKGSG